MINSPIDWNHKRFNFCCGRDLLPDMFLYEIPGKLRRDTKIKNVGAESIFAPCCGQARSRKYCLPVAVIKNNEI